jgi:hypothetical protein
MSDFVSDYELFYDAVDPNPADRKWSSLQNILRDLGDEFGDTSNWYRDALMELYRPLIDYPGGLPLIDEIEVTELSLQITWGRGGNVNSGGAIYLEEFDIGGGSIGARTLSNFEPLTTNTDYITGDPAFWNVNQTQMKAFLNGDEPLAFKVDSASINGSAETRIFYVKARVKYTYTGGGVNFPRLF